MNTTATTTRPAKRACAECGRYAHTVTEGLCQTCRAEQDEATCPDCDESPCHPDCLSGDDGPFSGGDR